MHPRQRLFLICMLYPLFFFGMFLFTPPDIKLVSTTYPSINHTIDNFSVNLYYLTSGDFTVGRKIQITSFLPLETTPSNYNWTSFELELFDENNETQGILNGNIWEDQQEDDYSIESRPWASSTTNRFFQIELRLPESELIQFKLEFWFEKKDFIPLFQDKWIFQFITDRFVIEPRPLIEQILLYGTELLTEYIQRQIMSRIISIVFPIVISVIIAYSRR